MKPNLKIAVFHDLIPGGSERCVQEFVKVLSKRHTIDFYRFTYNNKFFFDLTPFVRDIHTFEYKHLFLKRPFGLLNTPLVFVNRYYILEKIYYKIAKAIDKGNYDLVFIHPTLCCRYHVPGLLRYLSTPSAYYCHEPHRIHYEPYSDLVERGILPLTLKIQKIIFSPFVKLYMYSLKKNDYYCIKNADLVLCNSRYSREYIYKVYNILAKVNYLGVDARKFMPLDIPKENLVLSVGHLEKRKGHDFVILAIANIPREIRPKLGIVYFSGSEDDVVTREYKNYLEHLADDNRVEVSFFPDVSDDGLVLLYNKAKLTACAFRKEPFGFIPLESMACQVPVVAIEEGGLRESILHNQTGILTKRDAVEFTKAMEYLLKNEETRIRMGKSGRQHVLNNWSWERSTEELENNFLSLLRAQ